MSYPLVFKYDGRYYMIPESEENSTVDLYVAKDFPRGWKKEKTLISGVHYADTTLVEIESRKFLFTYSPSEAKWKIHIFELNMEKLEVTLFQTLNYSENICRPAGKSYTDELGRLVRPVQDCREGYGKGMLLYAVSFKDNKFTESLIEGYDKTKLIIDGKSGADYFHTYSRTSNYEVVDYMNPRFDLFKEVKWQIRKYKRYRRAKSIQ